MQVFNLCLKTSGAQEKYFAFFYEPFLFSITFLRIKRVMIVRLQEAKRELYERVCSHTCRGLSKMEKELRHAFVYKRVQWLDFWNSNGSMWCEDKDAVAFQVGHGSIYFVQADSVKLFLPLRTRKKIVTNHHHKYLVLW